MLKNTAQSIFHLLMDAYRDARLMGHVRVSVVSPRPHSSLGAGNGPVTQFLS